MVVRKKIKPTLILNKIQGFGTKVFVFTKNIAVQIKKRFFNKKKTILRVVEKSNCKKYWIITKYIKKLRTWIPVLVYMISVVGKLINPDPVFNPYSKMQHLVQYQQHQIYNCQSKERVEDSSKFSSEEITCLLSRNDLVYEVVLPGADGFKPNPNVKPMSPYGRPRMKGGRPEITLPKYNLPRVRFPHKNSENPHDNPCYGTGSFKISIEFEYKEYAKKLKEKYPDFKLTKKRYISLATRSNDGFKSPDRRGILEAEGMIPLEAQGLVKNLRRPNDKNCRLDFEGEDQKQFEGFTHFEHSRPLSIETLERRNEPIIPPHEQAASIGAKKVGQQYKAVERGRGNPKSVNNILVNVQLDDITDPIQKMQVMESCLNTVEEKGGNTSTFLFTDTET